MGKRPTLEDLQKMPLVKVVDHTHMPNNRSIVIPEMKEKYSAKEAKNIPGIKEDEDDIQRQYFKWFHYQYPGYSKRIFHIPNGGFRDKKTYFNKKAGKNITYSPTAKKLKQQGTLPGVWDVFLSVPKKGFSGMYIETKAGKNGLSEAQIDFREANKDDYLFEVCYSVEAFQRAVNNYLL